MRKILFAFIVLTAACASDSTTGPDDGNPGDGGGDGSDGPGDIPDDPNVSEADRAQDYDDVAASLAAHLSASELPVMIDAVDMSFGRMPAGFTFADTAEARVLDGTRGGLTLHYSLHCHAVDDSRVPCDGLQDHSHVDFSYSGTATSVNGSLAGIERSAKWIVRGSQRPRLWILGDGEDTFASTLPAGNYAVTITDTLDHVKFEPTPHTPVAGSITLGLVVDRTRPTTTPADRTFGVEARVDFTNAETATLTLDNANVYQLDIATGAAVRQ